MAKFQFPDPKDRSPNAPSIIAEKNQIIGLYNQEHSEDASYVTENVRTWFEEESIRQGWDKAHFAANQCLLTADVVLNKK
ncbi:MULTISPECIES: hypothetical protein [Pseudomonas]|uniref:Uncharacterized protein n=1 Tax=Pseudomonas peradeniyensis TaxID=2745488 RepID=A0ABT2V5W6_9PSED|nr:MULTISPECIES: hypothetical protein [Pseudomonas]MCU7236817.1 hypothetical protein [Pseudomonas peradeniyensis]UPF05821.1 hypothetical protein MXB02_09460 [Pseudomonas mosselii]